MKTKAIASDFADWLPPVLVKELRQGMRTRVFVMSYLATCIVLPVLFVLIAHLEASEQLVRWRESARFFWSGASAVLFLVLLPLNGLSALEVEIKNRNMELLTLTRMGSGALVFGKWAALFCQTLLLGTCLLPLCFLGYFLGQFELVRELNFLAALVSASGVASAVVIFLSRFPMWARITTLAVALFTGAPVVLILAGILVYQAPWALPFCVPLVLMVAFFLTRELISHPAEPVSKQNWLPAAVALFSPLLLAIPFFRSGLLGLVVIVIFAYLWMVSENNTDT